MAVTARSLATVWWDDMDTFVVRRIGWRWTVVCILPGSCVEREATFGARFWRRRTAERVAVALNKVMMDALWRAGAHPYQAGAVPVAAVGGVVSLPRPPAPGKG